MNVIIMGCGRVGARLAALLDAGGHKVTIIDTELYSFRQLPKTFNGRAITGDGLDGNFLRRIGIKEAKAFISVTQSDNRNTMAAQIAMHVFNVPKVICRICDPVYEEMYRDMGLNTISPTKIEVDLFVKAIESEKG
jgi:trk system potassium uptake protein TrkA